VTIKGSKSYNFKVFEFQQKHYTENFVQAVLDGGLGIKKKGSVLVVGGDGRFLCSEAVNVIIQIAAANGISRLIIGQNGFLSTPAVSNLIRKGFEGRKIDGGHHMEFDGIDGLRKGVKITNAIHDVTTKISHYSICPDLKCDFTRIGRNEYDVDGVGHFMVDIIDPVKDYVELMQSIFDFSKVRFSDLFVLIYSAEDSLILVPMLDFDNWTTWGFGDLAVLYE
uniref:PGM_PMM_I domain-containing protein n=1 Tax=Angiostrongylus cantonensis TaxID=6313 RepID=A0A0K0DLX8_ANGCA